MAGVDWNALVIGPTIGIFGDRVHYVARNGDFEITGVFDEQYLGLNPALGRGGPDTGGFVLGDPGAITSAMPVLGVQLSQFRYPPAQGDVLRVLSGIHIGASFEVREIQRDGHGHALLTLNSYEP